MVFKRRGGRRFIPAGAGNTVKKRFRRLVSTVYPRWRGEHISVRRPDLALNGLSPLARGTHFLLRMAFVAQRFIPAGAGNTAAMMLFFIMYPVYPRWRGEHGI